jgi:hypothetical protein
MRNTESTVPWWVVAGAGIAVTTMTRILTGEARWLLT